MLKYTNTIPANGKSRAGIGESRIEVMTRRRKQSIVPKNMQADTAGVGLRRQIDLNFRLGPDRHGKRAGHVLVGGDWRQRRLRRSIQHPGAVAGYRSEPIRLWTEVGTKKDKDRAVRSEMDRESCSAAGLIINGRSLDAAGIGPPKLGTFV